MNVFFGRISVNQEPKDQYSKGYYKADRGSSYFGELNSIADFKKEPTYVFMIGGTSVELWKAREWDKLGKSLLFDKVKVNLEGLNRAWLAAFKYFFLDKNLIVFTTRRPFKKAFFKLKVDESFTEKLLLNDSTYADDGNYRNIEIHESIPSENSRNIVLFNEDNKWKFKAPDFFDNTLESDFRDNIPNIGHGRKNKDAILNKVLNNKEFPALFNPDNLSLLNVYDAFFCDYNGGSIDDEILSTYHEILLINDENLYKISMSPKDISEEDYTRLIEDNLVVVHSDTPAMAKSYESQGDRFRNSIKIGDYFYLCRGNKRIELIGKFISDAKSCEKISLREEGWLQRRFELINECELDESYTGEKKWWTPNNNSTCIQIPDIEITASNDLLFIPFFSTLVKKDSYEGSLSERHIQSNENSNNMNLNSILFGPPGTGKTYSTIDKALLILEENTEVPREKRKEKFADYQKKGRIFFTTFHQNMAYEDFIEGIKPKTPEEEDEFLKYEIQDGLFMKACIEATYSYLSKSSNTRMDEIQSYLDYNDLFDKLYNEVFDAGSLLLNTKSAIKVTVTTTSQGNFWIRHDGKEKPYTVSRERLSVLYDKFPDLSKISNITKEFRNAIGGCNSTAYWSILNKIKELENESKKSKGQRNESPDSFLGYDQKKEIVKKYWNLRGVKKSTDTDLEPYVFIIDEINRGNVSQIFGELITLIEEDKRLGSEEVLYIDLPYSKQAFAVPPNLYIIGTMNTADRSVEAIDTALRRRFTFEAKLPEPSKLKQTDDGVDLPLLLDTLNNRLKILKDGDHTIGHAWLWNIENTEDLKAVFSNKILPLLQEYFYNDYEKLGLVLGDSFFNLPHKQVKVKELASFTGGKSLASQYSNSYVFELKPSQDLRREDFISIYHTVHEPE